MLQYPSWQKLFPQKSEQEEEEGEEEGEEEEHETCTNLKSPPLREGPNEYVWCLLAMCVMSW